MEWDCVKGTVWVCLSHVRASTVTSMSILKGMLERVLERVLWEARELSEVVGGMVGNSSSSGGGGGGQSGGGGGIDHGYGMMYQNALDGGGVNVNVT
jgi:uncharacterized membrane protein YgcG